jgi:hypothetical protein
VKDLRTKNMIGAIVPATFICMLPLCHQYLARTAVL